MTAEYSGSSLVPPFARQRGPAFWFGVGILGAGIILLLDVFNVAHVSRGDVVAVLLFLFGATIVVRAFARESGNAQVLGGTMLFLAGIVLVLLHLDIIAMPSGKGLGTFFLVAGLAIVMNVVYDRSQKKYLLVSAVLCTVGTLVLFDIISLSMWSLGGMLWRWWPLAIIALGVMMFLRRQRRL